MAPTAVPFEPANTYSLRMFTAVRAVMSAHTQREVAAMLGVSEARVSQMMRGGENWTIESVQRVLMACERLAARKAMASV